MIEDDIPYTGMHAHLDPSGDYFDVCEECGKDSGLHSIYCSMHEKAGAQCQP